MIGAPTVFRGPTVALFPFGYVFEDFLDTIGVSLEEFCSEMTGGWLFGYVEALRLAGLSTLIVITSMRRKAPARIVHQPTGATILVLPAPRLYRGLRRRMTQPYGHSVSEAFGGRSESSALVWPLLALCKELAPYLCTPALRLVRELRATGCRALLCQEYEFPRFDVCVLLGRLLRLPVFATFQGGDHQRGWLERWLRPLSVRAAAGLIAGSSAEVRRLRATYRLPAAKIARIGNPIDLGLWPKPDRQAARERLGLPRSARIAIWHGRVLFHSKALDVLVRAWARICQDRLDDLRLVLIGTGPDAGRLEQLLDAERLSNVTWINRYVRDRETTRMYLSAADVYAFPSRHEGFPVAPLEAMACELPVVASDVPGAADILRDGAVGGGLLVPPDDVPAFARALAGLLDDPRRSRELGRLARRRVEECYSVEAVGRQLGELLS